MYEDIHEEHHRFIPIHNLLPSLSNDCMHADGTARFLSVLTTEESLCLLLKLSISNDVDIWVQNGVHDDCQPPDAEVDIRSVVVETDCVQEQS